MPTANEYLAELERRAANPAAWGNDPSIFVQGHGYRSAMALVRKGLAVFDGSHNGRMGYVSLPTCK